MTSVVMSAHGKAIDNTYGLAVVPNGTYDKVQGCLASIVSFHPERFTDLTDQAAHLACRIAQDHCFPDGNKRTAIITAVVFMETYGAAVSCSQHDLVEAGMAASQGNVGIITKILNS